MNTSVKRSWAYPACPDCESDVFVVKPPHNRSVLKYKCELCKSHFMLVRADPGATVVLQNREGYCCATADESGVVRNEDGQSFSDGAYNVVRTETSCEACGADDFNLITGTDQLVCSECGHR